MSRNAGSKSRPGVSTQARSNVTGDPTARGGRTGWVQAWRAWTGCGDGGQVDLIIDLQARETWLLPAEETNIIPRSAR
jgi:hypothetical protein